MKMHDVGSSLLQTTRRQAIAALSAGGVRRPFEIENISAKIIGEAS